MNSLTKYKLLQNTTSLIIRNYAFKSDLKIKWNRPEKIPCYKPEKSGDLQPIASIDPKEFIKDFTASKELQTADEYVKRLFTLDHNPRKERIYRIRDSMVEQVRRHPLDYGSMEAKLADMTGRIRSLQEHMEEFPRQGIAKVQLKELIDKRKKFLKYLRRWDYKRFEWILEKLDLVYKPHPPKYHWITRKESLVKLTNTHCDQIRNQKLEEYRQKLESQQLDFLENKLKNLQFIRKEQEECGVEVTISNKQIQVVSKQYEELKEKRKLLTDLQED